MHENLRRLGRIEMRFLQRVAIVVAELDQKLFVTVQSCVQAELHFDIAGMLERTRDRFDAIQGELRDAAKVLIGDLVHNLVLRVDFH